MWNVTLRVCLNSGSLSFFSRAKVTSTTQCKTCSILNFDWVNLVFATLSRIFRGHEAGLLHAYWVIISCGLCFCTRCPWQDLISDAVVKCFISFDLCLLRLKNFAVYRLRTYILFKTNIDKSIPWLRQKMINSIPCLREKSRKTYPGWPHMPIKPL